MLNFSNVKLPSTIKQFCLRVSKTMESGLIEVWNKMYSPKPKFCEIIEDNYVQSATNKPLSIHELIGAFYIFLIGAAVSWLIFLIEQALNQLCGKWFSKLKSFKNIM